MTYKKKVGPPQYVSSREYGRKTGASSHVQEVRVETTHSDRPTEQYSEHTEGVVPTHSSTKPKKRVPSRTCFMDGCSAINRHMKKHVVGKHLPTECYSREGNLPPEERFSRLQDVLIHIGRILGCDSLQELLKKVVDLKYYPSADFYEITEEDLTFLDKFNIWLDDEHLRHTPSINPPNMIAALVHWRALAHLINCVGEERVAVKGVTKKGCHVCIDTVDVDGDHVEVTVETPAVPQSANDTSDVTVDKPVASNESTEPVPTTSQVTEKPVASNESTQAIPSTSQVTVDKPAVSEETTHKSLSDVYKKWSQQEKEPFAEKPSESISSIMDMLIANCKYDSEGETPMEVQSNDNEESEVITDVQLVTCKQEPEPEIELDVGQESSFSEAEVEKVGERVEKAAPTDSIKVASADPPETASKPKAMVKTFAEAVATGTPIKSESQTSKPPVLGVPYPAKEREMRMVRLVKNSQRIPFVDSHFHLDRLQQKSRLSSLNDILDLGPMPVTPIKVEEAVANFIDGVPSCEIRKALAKDPRLFFTFGVHPKRANKVTPEEIKAIKHVVVKETRCVGIGEMGIEMTSGCSCFLDKQVKVLKEQLKVYISKELWSTVIVIHCRDYVGSEKASDVCLNTMASQLPSQHKGTYKIHRHCFNGGLKEKDLWLAQYPNTVFGFTGLILSSERHPEIDTVVRSLQPHQIVLESDAPYLLPPCFKNEPFNTPYGIDEVARRIAFLRGLTVRQVLELASHNTQRLYGKMKLL